MSPAIFSATPDELRDAVSGLSFEVRNGPHGEWRPVTVDELVDTVYSSAFPGAAARLLIDRIEPVIDSTDPGSERVLIRIGDDSSSVDIRLA